MNSGFATPLPHHADALHRHSLRRAGHIFFYYSLCINYLLCNILLLLSLLLSPVCTISYALENDLGWAVSSTRCTDIPRHLGWTGGFVNTSLPHAGDFGVTLLACIGRAMSPLWRAELFCFATSGPAWGMEPCPASSSDRVVNTEHINQLSCLHAPSFKFFICVRFDQALYFFGKKLLVKNLLVKTLFVTHKFKYPIHLGASFMKLFHLHMIILVRLCSLFVYYATICTILT